jgi:hypothetical protein
MKLRCDRCGEERVAGHKPGSWVGRLHVAKQCLGMAMEVPWWHWDWFVNWLRLARRQ